MPKAMHAVWVEKPGGLEALEDRELPIPEPREGEVRVRIKAIGLNPVDAAWRRGEHLPPLPGVLGRDFAGVVDKVGPGVRRLELGIADIEPGAPVLGYAGGGSNGTYAEYVCVHAAMLGTMRPMLGFERAAALPVAALTANELLWRLSATVDEEDRVLVTGASGAVGALVVSRLCRDGTPVVATTSSDEGERRLVRLGVSPDDIIRVDRGSPEAWLAQLDIEKDRPFNAVDLVGGRLKQFCLEALSPRYGQLYTIVEEPPEFGLAVFDERTSLWIKKSLGLHFVQLSSALAYEDASLREGVYGDPVMRAAEGAAMNGIDFFFENLTVLGPLSAETARKGHALLDARAARGKLVMTVP